MGSTMTPLSFLPACLGVCGAPGTQQRAWREREPSESALSVAGGDPIAATVAGVRIPPQAALAGVKEPGESPTSAHELGIFMDVF